MELKDRGVEVFEARKEKMKQIQKKKKEDEENYKKKVEHYAACILNVFDASNLEENSDILVWRIKIMHLDTEEIKCEVDFNPNDVEEREFWEIRDLKKWEHHDKVQKVMTLMQTIEAFECTPTIVQDIRVFLRTHLDEDKYSFLLDGEEDYFIISMNEPTISEEE